MKNIKLHKTAEGYTFKDWKIMKVRVYHRYRRLGKSASTHKLMWTYRKAKSFSDLEERNGWYADRLKDIKEHFSKIYCDE